MKFAILIVGHIRTWLQCKDNFVKSFEHLNPDVYVSTYDLQFNYHPAQRRWMGGSMDTFLSKTDIEFMFDGVNVIEFDFETIRDVVHEYNTIKPMLDGKFDDEMNSFLQNRKIKRAIHSLKKNEIKTNELYDVVIKIRADIHYSKFDYKIDKNNVFVSEGNVFPNDVIIAAERDNFIKLFEFIESEFYNPKYIDSHLRPPHTLLLNACKHFDLNLKTGDSMQYVVRKSGNQYYNNNGSIN